MPRRAKLTAHFAPNLRGHTQSPPFFSRYIHRFDPVAVAKHHHPLRRSVVGLSFLRHLYGGERKTLGALRLKLPAQIGHLREIVHPFLVDPAKKLPGTVSR